MKRLHFLFLFLILAGMTHAQVIEMGGPLKLQSNVANNLPSSMFTESIRHAPSRKAIAIDSWNQMWWGHYTGSETLVGIGVNNQLSTFNCAMRITQKHTIAYDKEIKALRFIVDCTKGMSSFKVWLSESLPATAEEADVVTIDVPLSNLVDNRFVEVELPKAYAITSKGVYVGMSYTINKPDDAYHYPILITYYNKGENGAWLKVPGNTGLDDWVDLSPDYGNLPIQVLLDGEFDHNAVSASSSFNDVYALVNGTAEAVVTLTSEGLGKVSSIDYTETTPEGTSEERHVDFVPFEGMGAQQDVRIPLTADAKSGRTERTIKINKVNGVPNENGIAVSKGYMVSLSQSAKKKVLVEEFTGTWCGWCPRGIVGLDMLNEKYADDVVTIAIHGDDPMAIVYGVEAPSYPYALVGRTTPADPYFGVSGEPFGIGDLVAEQLQIPAEASITLSEPLMDANGKITFSTDLVFNYSSDNAPYTLAFAVLTDGLTGDTKKWAQANYYSHAADWAGYPDLKAWYEDASYVKQVYNHVAIAGKGIANGLTGSVKAPIVEGETKTYNGYVTVSGNSLTSNLDRLSVVAMLINKTTGAVVNVDKRAVTIAENFPVNKATVSDFDMATAVLGSTTTARVPMKNYGRDGVKSIDYTVRAGTQESEVIHLDLAEPLQGIGVSRYVDFQLPADTVSGIVNRSIMLKQVNGKENESTTGTAATGKLMTIAKVSPRKTVIEEFTGTWCMWCGRGIAGLKRAHDEYPNDVVLMAIHSGSGSSTDPMQNSVFNTIISGHSFPSADVNRYRATDPYLGDESEGWGLGKVIEEEQAKLTEAGICLSTPILDEETGIISFTTDVTFQINRRSAPYLLSYVLIGDGLMGSGDNWTQVNAYNAYAGSYDDDPYMKEITDMPFYVTDMVYDHVAINALGISGGLTGSLKNRVEEGQVQSHSSQFTIKNNSLAKKATKLYVAALLYDKGNNCFINADQKEVVSSTVGIRQIENGESTTENGTLREVARFSVDGKPLAHPQKGLNIIRMSDGSVRKVVVR